MIPSRLQYLVPELQAVMGLLLWAVSPSHSQYLVPELRMASDQFSLARFPHKKDSPSSSPLPFFLLMGASHPLLAPPATTSALHRHFAPSVRGRLSHAVAMRLGTQSGMACINTLVTHHCEEPCDFLFRSDQPSIQLDGL